ncbi:carboxypeptidase-like regulatory domain-containing protein [Pontibacter sp. JH31]|uniref:Carboxypeptidase-like regulatory domain-containing protein n=1 Tax=Pontibacter aquaedesilientis TaxID=2766980 RepID=A0ABR7XDJ1_9BACT|nr:carboxypeptidase regulatory-like domain-containing protein [Pontibacter aquaedesilientis]MBD1396363.1 carboxypeptidase-like regulatory domain-containing protein [Pontibacter aquaedesilientis]
MRSDKIANSHWGLDQHPSTETLRQYEEGILSSALSNELERHLMDCELCEDILSGMALADRNRTQQAKNRILQRIRTRLRKNRRRPRALHGLGDWRVATAVLMMFVSLGLLLFYHYTRSVTEEKRAAYPGGILPPTPEELLARTIDSALVLDIPAPPVATRNRPDAQAVANRYLLGQIVSANGTGIADAMVQWKGTDQSTRTNAAGNFRLELVPENHALLISATGYIPQEIKAAQVYHPIKVTMVPSNDPKIRP